LFLNILFFWLGYISRYISSYFD